MIFYILAALAVLVIILTFVGLREAKDAESDLARFFVVFASLSLVGLYLMGNSMMYQSDTKAGVVDSTRTYAIVAMGNSTAISGSGSGRVFAAYGRIESNQVINYVVQGKDGGLHLRQSDASTTTVYEGKGEPRVVKQYLVRHLDYSFWVPWMTGELEAGTRTLLYVPKVTVDRQFELNAGK